MTYPAITQFSKNAKSRTLIILDKSVSPGDLYNSISDRSNSLPENVIVRNDIGNGELPWLLGNLGETALVQRLERDFPALEEAGCRVFIGAATGNNKVFLIDNSVDIEEDRKVPVVTARDIREGEVTKSEKYLINTYDDLGVINLDDYPKLKLYLEIHKEALINRHIAKLQPKNWFKTIDRVYPERAESEKLLIPDIKSRLEIVHESGVLHPSNSLYYICSGTWNLVALKALLLSGIGKLFIETYSTKVANGFLRFQSQHLRRIRIPHWADIAPEVQDKLIKAGQFDDVNSAKMIIKNLYMLTDYESELLGI